MKFIKARINTESCNSHYELNLKFDNELREIASLKKGWNIGNKLKTMGEALLESIKR